LEDPTGSIVAEDDDGGNELDSTISEYELEQSGEYTIVATSFNDGGTFQYELTLTLNESGGSDGRTNGSGDDGFGTTEMAAIGGGGGLVLLLGAYALARQSSDETETDATPGTPTKSDTPSGEASDSTAPQSPDKSVETSTSSASSSTARRGPVGDETSEAEIRVESKLDIASTRLNDARQIWELNDYDRALNMCQDAREATETAREIAREEASRNFDGTESLLKEIDQTENKIRTERDSYQQVTDQLDIVANQLSDTAGQIETQPEAALTRIDDAESKLEDAAEKMEAYTFPDATERLQRLRNRCEKLREKIPDK
jgi:hypothetical protein